jgi:hypothetical protein
MLLSLEATCVLPKLKNNDFIGQNGLEYGKETLICSIIYGKSKSRISGPFLNVNIHADRQLSLNQSFS